MFSCGLLPGPATKGWYVVVLLHCVQALSVHHVCTVMVVLVVLHSAFMDMSGRPRVK